MSTSSDTIRAARAVVSAPEDALAGLVQAARSSLSDRFGLAAQWLAAAPGRVNVIGEHTDYNDGFVLPMAIDKHVVLAAAPTGEHGSDGRAATGVAEIWSHSLGESVLLPVKGSPKGSVPHWASYLQGVLAAFLERGAQVPPFKAVLLSDIPLGGGLSSSAALEVAMATLLEGVTKTSLPRQEKARLCRWAEHEFAGVPCGVMDQLASVMGQESGPLLIDCRDESVTPVPMADQSVGLLVCNSNVKHSLGDGAYARRRAECSEAARLLGAHSLRDVTLAEVTAAESQLGPLLSKRARHVVSENERTLAAAEALRKGDFGRAGALMYESHRSLRDDYEVSVWEIDLLVDLAAKVGLSGGVYGSRITGGGFGGCTVSLVKTADVEAIARVIAEGYEAATGIKLGTFLARPAAGARLLELTSGASLPTSASASNTAGKPAPNGQSRP